MKTRPVKQFLSLPIKIDEEDLMNFYYEAVHEMVCYGTHILEWILKKNIKDTAIVNEFSLAAPLIFRHTLELLDSISVQLKAGVIIPCKLQLRAILESYLSLEYMLEQDELREQRAACFFIVDQYKILNLCKKYTAGTQENKDFTDNLEDEKFHMSDYYKGDDFKEIADKTQNLVNIARYENVNKEYLRYTNGNKKKLDNLKWYALFGGPRNLYELAAHLKLLNLYEYLYKPWSNPIHGTNLSLTAITNAEKGIIEINELRKIGEAGSIIELTLIVGITVFMCVVEKVIPKELKGLAKWTVQFNDYYLTKIKTLNSDNVTV